MYLKETGAVSLLLDSESLLHISFWPLAHHLDSIHEERRLALRRWMVFLKEEGYDFEQRDEYSQTALQYHLGKITAESLAASLLLVEFGADIHVTDSKGQNVLWYAMDSFDKYRWKRGYMWVQRINLDQNKSNIVEQKLSYLIKARVDIHHRDMQQNILSLAALNNDCWKEWCRALKTNGLCIRDVLEAEGRDPDSFPVFEDRETDEDYGERA